MRRWLALMVLLVSTGPMLAETIGVRAGEHSGFSRIVLDRAGQFDWIIGRTTTGYALRPNGATVEFDVGRAMRDLRGGRIKDVIAAGTTLSIDLDCVCSLKTYTLAGGRFVLDISKGAADPLAATEQPFPTIEPSPAAATDVAGVEAPPVAPQPATTMASEAGTQNLPDFIDGVLGSPGVTATTGDAAELNASNDLAQFENMLLGSLARAAAEGFVTSGDTTSSTIATSGDAALDASPGAEGRTAYDIARDAEPAVSDPGICRATQALDFLTDALAFDDVSLGELVRNVYGDGGTLSLPDARRLAEFLLWKGYGAEAAQVIDLAAIDGDAGMLLTAAAFALDGRRASGDVDLAAFALCDGTGALWALLGGADNDLTTQIDIRAAIQTYSTYPPHLRRIIGPLLVTDLLTHDRADDARLAATFIPGGENEPATVDPSLAEISIGLETGDEPTAPDDLTALIRDGGPQTHDAVLLQSKHLSETAQAPTDTEIETLQALQADADPAGQAGDLFLTELRRMLDGSEFLQVLERLDGPHPEVDQTQATALEAEAWSGLIALGRDFDLALAVRKWHAPGDELDVAPALRTRLTERLADIGLSGETAPTADIAPPVAADPVAVAPNAANPLDEPLPIKSARSALAAVDQERAALEAILNGD